jgi:ubiquitin-protein ligase E3 B
VVKIEFINEFGLKEAGIDQSGVFKEFLEETCKRAFTPDINLFQSAANRTFCISHTSSIHENHLQIFFFIGRILGKALYDGIVLDIPLARFIFAKFLGRYNFFEDLPYLDAELYKNLVFLKHYQGIFLIIYILGDIHDLSLFFTVDEVLFGNIVTKEIKYGGANIPVTKENRFEYIFLMADYKLNRQCHAQYDAFVRGFKAIISSQWLQLFSPRELEKLMSGQNESFGIFEINPIDLVDLKPFVKYEGGYSESSPTIRHLWEILQDFNASDKALFLKFVTSCSRPPVGGFKCMV